MCLRRREGRKEIRVREAMELLSNDSRWGCSLLSQWPQQRQGGGKNQPLQWRQSKKIFWGLFKLGNFKRVDLNSQNYPVSHGSWEIPGVEAHPP